MRTVAIVQARMGSLRLPGKVMRDVSNQTVIQRLLARLEKSKTIDKIVLSTTQLSSDDELAQHVENLGFPVFRGAEDDVLKRFLDTATQHEADLIVRITGDCPVIDHAVVDKTVSLLKSSNADYCSNVEPPTFPNGLDVEVFSIEALRWADQLTLEISDREHVTTLLRKDNNLNRENLFAGEDFSALRWTLDTSEDLEVIRNIFSAFDGSNDFSWTDVLKLVWSSPSLFSPNLHLQRNHGTHMSVEEKKKLAGSK